MKSEPALAFPSRREPASPLAPWAMIKALLACTAALASLAVAVPARCAASAPAKSRPDKDLGTRVSGVTVTASRAVPHVQSTFPATGAKVTPGLLVLRVTYDTRMKPDGWSYAREKGADYPDCATSPRLLDDGRSFVLICRTLPGKTYSVWFNRPPMSDFASVSRRPAPPFELSFATTDEEPLRTLSEAMKADPALSNLANPVEPDGLAVYGQHDDAPGD